MFLGAEVLMVKAGLPKLAVFGDSRKEHVAEAIAEFECFAVGKAEIVARCGVEECSGELLEGADFAVVFGGDGSIISAVRELSESEVPVIGVNVGKLGFLAEFSVDELKDFFPQLSGGEVAIERRMQLLCTVLAGGEERFRSVGVNDVFIAAGPPFRTIELQMSVDGQSVGGCVSDGLVICTPTGSTAYNLSAGGPILSRKMEAMVMTPICAHSLSFRPMVIKADSAVEVSPVRLNKGTTVSVDGQVSQVFSAGDVVRVQRSGKDFLIVNNPLRSEWDTLAAKLGWAEKPKYKSV